MMCGEGSEVFMVPTSGDRESLNGPHIKILKKKKKKKKERKVKKRKAKQRKEKKIAQQRNIANGV